MGAREGRPIRLRVGRAVGRGAGGSSDCRGSGGCRGGGGGAGCGGGREVCREMTGFGPGLRSTQIMQHLNSHHTKKTESMGKRPHLSHEPQVYSQYSSSVLQS